jgi:phenylalanyl-tRNA synthetase alpha chain
MSIFVELENIKQEAIRKVTGAETSAQVEELRVEYLGRKGILTSILHKLGTLPSEEKPKFGKEANIAKDALIQKIEAKLDTLNQKEEDIRLKKEFIDTTLPGVSPKLGHIHPITQTMQEIIDIFTSMGFEIAEGPEIETEHYNFDSLNFQKDHPARDMQDTFFFDNNLLLRTHTSPVQIRVMESHTPPMKIIAPGKVYRCDADISHSPMFHQIEGFMVDYNINFRHLKGILSSFLTQVFGENTKVQFRPSFFPFTEPSAEVDISCIMCHGKGCRVCGNSGWIEILGAGMIHPNVLKSAGYTDNKYTGLAFGLGIERITMLKYGINDIRMFYENDLRFLQQF